MFRRDSLCNPLHGVSNNGTIYWSIYGLDMETLWVHYVVHYGSSFRVCIYVHTLGFGGLGALDKSLHLLAI